jgi:methionyl-tRNA synthetase
VSGAKAFYITTAIDYANGPPHMGHAFEKIGADVMARYRRSKGEKVHLVLGMDEHGLKVLQSAESAGITPQQWVDALAEKFRTMWDRLLISYDDFMRTTEPRHRRAAEELIRRIQASGDIYRSRYEGYYCVGCEAFKRKDELITDEGNVLRCPIHPSRQVEWNNEENWFFRLSRYQQRLLNLYDERPDFVQPETRRNEVRRLVEDGLEDISVSRAGLEWGIPLPGDESQTVYVWIEALMNYVSATGFPRSDYTRLWPADYHVVGKDITRFHCVIWPAMLMSAGLEPPRSVWAHGFFNFEGRKLSKSDGVRVELDEAIDRYGADAFRYYILREVPWNGDGDFSWDRFDARYTADLADDFGNLANRAISMIEKYRGGVVPRGAHTSLDRDVASAVARYRAAMDANLLHMGAAAAMELAAAGNGFVETRAPWSQAKDPAQAAQLDATLGALARAVAALIVLLAPFIPSKAEHLAGRLGLERVPLLDEVATLDLAGRRVARGAVLFPKPTLSSA